MLSCCSLNLFNFFPSLRQISFSLALIYCCERQFSASLGCIKLLMTELDRIISQRDTSPLSLSDWSELK